MESKDVSSNISTEILQARLEELRAENVRLLLKQEQLILENFEKDKLLAEALAEKIGFLKKPNDYGIN